MDLQRLVNDNSENKKKYEYYRSLGYGEKASTVLSLLTYGNRPLKTLIMDLPKEHLLDQLYDWLLEQNAKDPMDAVNRYLSEKTRKTQIIEDGVPGGSAGGGLFSRLFGSAPRGAKKSAMRDGGARGLDAPMMDEGNAGYMAAGMAMTESLQMMEVGKTVALARAPRPRAMEESGACDEECVEPLEELVSTDSYEQIEEKDARSVLTEPTSTFRMTTNTSSMGIVLNQIREGRHVDLSQVRIEELLNYFSYDEETAKEEKFRIHTELCDKNEGKELLYIYAGARAEEKKKQNIIILLDVSGSMSSRNVITQEILATVVSKLSAGDTLSLITYSSNDETVYDGFTVNGDGDKEDIMGRILGIVISGCTNGSAGIETAYTCGAKYFKEGGNNQVILITDGDLNFGITKKDGLKTLIEEKKKSNLFLSVIGTGLYNYKDDKLEVLSKHGNGTYCVVNNLEDVKESVCRRYVSLTSIVAKDVKAQVEFNPRYVKEYRLLGYENRALSHADFKNDAVISEPYGSGGYGVALYELALGNALLGESELKYQTPMLTDSEELCTVKLRYKEPLSDVSSELSQPVSREKNGGENVRLARFLYCIAEKLRESEKLGEDDEAFYKSMLEDSAYEKLPGGNTENLKLLVEYIERNS